MTPHLIPHFYTSLPQSPLFSCWSTSPLDPSGRRRAHSQRLNRDGKEKHVWSHHHMLLLWCNESIFSNNDVGVGKQPHRLHCFPLNLHCQKMLSADRIRSKPPLSEYELVCHDWIQIYRQISLFVIVSELEPWLFFREFFIFLLMIICKFQDMHIVFFFFLVIFFIDDNL